MWNFCFFFHLFSFSDKVNIFHSEVEEPSIFFRFGVAVSFGVTINLTVKTAG